MRSSLHRPLQFMSGTSVTYFRLTLVWADVLRRTAFGCRTLRLSAVRIFSVRQLPILL